MTLKYDRFNSYYMRYAWNGVVKDKEIYCFVTSTQETTIRTYFNITEYISNTCERWSNVTSKYL